MRHRACASRINYVIAGENVKRNTAVLTVLVLIGSLLALSGCATKPAPEFNGRWRPINRFSESPQEIALYQSYTYYAAPLDGTLKNMLERWAKDSKMSLSYLAPMDYTLHEPVAEIHTADIRDAASRLTAIYAPQSLVVSVEDSQIVVRPTPVAETAPSTTVTP